MSDKRYIEQLAAKWIDGRISPDEKDVFNSWYDGLDFSELEILDDRIGDERVLKARILSSIKKNIPQFSKVRRLNVLRISSVAAAVLLLCAGIWWFSDFNHIGSDNSISVAAIIKPGKFGAKITLANGKEIPLSDKHEVAIISEDVRYENGVEVSGLSSSLNNEVQILSASTGLGQTYSFVLPDGSKVWLNAGSKLDFPSDFDGVSSREVRLFGECYFEVAKDKLHPFIVRVIKADLREERIEVLGTKFNISGYPGEEHLTTLVEGSIRFSSVSGGDQVDKSLIVKPNEQVSVVNGDILLKSVDAELAVAWKNNKFVFGDKSIREVMAMLGRWYNVEVVYQGAVPAVRFRGTVSRFEDISSVLSFLEESGGLHFKLEGRTIYVSN